ncbi:hypothetical protein CPB86DRAFT_745650 [Serendipita vermifera]|nr:hypothetical protein CPB86DRAFT_745650 [Serendipita vermifera]
MKILILTDLSVEVSTGDDRVLSTVPHLILEIAHNGEAIAKVKLLPHKSSPTVWAHEDILVLRNLSTSLTVSVSMEVDGNVPQVLGSKELNGYDELKNPWAIPLTPHESYPSLIFKARPVGVTDIRKLLSHPEPQPGVTSDKKKTLDERVKEAFDTFRDYERHRNPGRLAQAIVHFQNVSNIMDEGDPTLPKIMDYLGICLFRRYQMLGNVADVNESISRHEVAMKLTPEGSPETFGRLNNLAVSLAVRFERLKSLTDLENAIKYNQMTIGLIPDGHPNKAMYLNHQSCL